MADPYLSPSRRSETSYLALAIAPLIIVLGLLIFGLTQQWSAQRYVQAELATLHAAGRPQDVNTRHEERIKNLLREEDSQWRDVRDEIYFLEYKYGEAFQILDKSVDFVPASKGWPSAKLAEAYHKEAAPLIARIKELVAEAKAQHKESLAYLPGYAHWSGDDLIVREFEYAFHKGDSAYAADLLELYVDSTKTVVRLENVLPPYELIQQSLKNDFWNAEDLERVRRLLGVHVDQQELWRLQLDGDLATLQHRLQMIDEGDASDYGGGPDAYPFGLPPTYAESQLRYYADLDKLENAGTREHVLATRALERRWHENQGAVAVASTAAVPWAICNLNSGFEYADNNAVSLATEVMKQRRAVTAVAIKQFQLQEGRWPRSLSELTKVGLTASDWKMVDGIDFGYRVEADGETARLWSYARRYQDHELDMFDKDFRLPLLPPSELPLSRTEIESAEMEIR